MIRGDRKMRGGLWYITDEAKLALQRRMVYPYEV